MNIGTLLDQLAVDLADAAPGHTNQSWSREQLRAYLREGLQLAFSNRPDLFMELKVIKLEPCTEIQQACDCDSIRRVIGQSTESGRVIKDIRPTTSSDKVGVWTGPKCASDPDDYEINSYSVDADSGLLRISPPVPARKDVWVLVECAVRPSDYDDSADIRDDVATAAIRYALSRALFVDGEYNPQIIAVAERHEAAFWRILNLDKNSKLESESGGDSV